MIVILNDGTKMVTHGDYLYKKLQNRNYYEFDKLTHMSKYISTDKYVIDIGANIGNHTIYYSKIAKEVFSIEPIKKNYTLLKNNIDINNIKNTNLFNIGISSENKIMYFIDKNISNYGSCMLSNVFSNDCEIVNIQSLDYFIDNNRININDISLIKIDVEGMAMDVLKGSHKTLTEGDMVLFVECKDDTNIKENYEEIYDFLSKYNYVLEKSYDSRDKLFKKHV